MQNILPLLYLEEALITHLLYPMHMFRNVTLDLAAHIYRDIQKKMDRNS